MNSKKENLVLVHSFPTNSVLLHGLVSLLDDFFNVYFIDLPGFHKNVTPLEKISVDSYAKFVDKKIKEFNLEHYLIGGISLGFYIVNEAQLTQGCKGIVAIEPMIGKGSMRMNLMNRFVYLVLVHVISILNLYHIAWDSKLIRQHYKKITNYPLKRYKVIYKHFDPRTFFETVKAILRDGKTTVLKQGVPYILIINPRDKVIRGKYIIEFFQENAKHLLIVTTRVGHHPRTVTKNYYSRVLPRKVFEKVYRFIENVDDEADRFITIYE
jgi:hypothetical protein